MKQAAAAPLIKVQDLQIGMFVHLDGGWLSHPFPRNSFKISSADQIATIRSLGVAEVGWSPERSDVSKVASQQQDEAPADTAILVELTPPASSAEDTDQTLLRDALAQQRASQEICEREFNDAAKALRKVNQLVLTQPQVAREESASLARALATKMAGDRETYLRMLSEGAGERSSAHAMNVTVIAMLLGRSLGLSEQELTDLSVGAMLHDIGKIGLPDRVRSYDHTFTADELAQYQSHVALGVAHAKRMGLSPGVIDIIAQHHEQADGKGFPARLPAEKTNRLARIVALSNRYDNLCNPPLPSRALTPHEAVALIFAQGGTVFGGPMLTTFIRTMGVYPPGSAVQLTDERYALVLSVNPSRPLKPRVLVHDTHTPAEDALMLNLEDAGELGIRRSLKAQQLPPAALEYLAPRQRVAYFFESTPAALDALSRG